MTIHHNAARTRVFLFILVLFSLVYSASGQGMDRIERGRLEDMLSTVKSKVKENYYDPNFRNINLDEKFALAKEKLAKAQTTSQGISIIAQTLIDFNDSHLFFIPPSTTLAVEYGLRLQMIGDKCYIVEVRPKSDAEAKGLKVGDEVIALAGFKPSRKELWKALYYYNAIGKRDKLTLTVLSPGDEAPRDLEIKSQMRKRPGVVSFESWFRLNEDFYNEENDKHRFMTKNGVMIWRMPSFEFLPEQVDHMMDRAKGTKGLILDLRGNGGGYVKTMERLAGHFFDKDMKIADLQGRKKMDPSTLKTKGKDVYKGQLVILLDSNSASASEIFARLAQLEKRGTVIGDVSSGAVMQSRSHQVEMGSTHVIVYAVSVTNADVIMSDGKSLEHVGVVPDEIVRPTAEDLAAGRDPVMMRALQKFGIEVPPAESKFFKYYWAD